MSAHVSLYKWSFHVFLFSCLALFSQNAISVPEGWFSFPVDARKIAPDNLASVDFLNQGPATERIISRDGHFMTESGEPVRFFGTNLCFSAALPDKELAIKIAKRMKQLGFNVVRFHHLDNRHILNKDKTALDPVQLDKLHWMMFQLKENGIYANLNLHVSREYKELGALKKFFKYGKGLDRFYPPMIESQKRYAKAFLTTINPYTHMAPKDDPMVAFVEINNENSITDLLPEKNLEALPNNDIRRELRSQWTAWLLQKYPSLDALKKQWAQGSQPYSKQNLLDGLQTISEGAQEGYFEVTAVGKHAYDFKLLQNGTVAWAYQHHFINIPYKEGQHYTIKFTARSSTARDIRVNMSMHEPPWKQYHSQKIHLDNEWQDYSISAAIINLMTDKKTRFTFNLGGLGIDKPLDIQIKNIAVHEGDEPPNYQLVKTISDLDLPQANTIIGCLADYRQFLIDTEYTYTKRMVQYVKQELGVKSLLVDTQASYSGCYGLVREGQLCDYIDMHAYWQHPRFEPGHPWSPIYWSIPNTAMSASETGGTFISLLANRLAGKPFSVSEYNHPAPNEHASEMYPMFSSFGAFQDWDALYQFAYGSPDTDQNPAHLNSYFSMYAHPAQMVMAPVAALIFRGRLVKPAMQTATLELPITVLQQNLSSRIVKAITDLADGPQTLIGKAKFQIRLVDKGDAPRCLNSDALTGIPLRSEEINWTFDQNKQGVYTVTAPAVRAATGAIGNREIKLDDFSFQLPLAEKETASIAIAAMDGKPLKESHKMLLAVVGKIENPDMGWNEARTTVTNNWGKPLAMSPFIPFTVTLPGQERPVVQALDGEGRPIGTLDVMGTPQQWQFKATTKTPSLWFIITR